MYRILGFVIIILLSLIFSWWIFIPASLLLVYLARVPYEIIIGGFILDSVYYFGDSFLLKNQLTIFSAILVFLAILLEKRVEWRKRI